MDKKKKDIIFLILRILFSFGILAFLFIKIGFGEVISALLKASIPVILIMVAFNFIFFFIGAENLFLLSKLPNRKIGYWKMLKYMILSYSYGLFLPGKIGEFSLIYFMKKDGYEVGETTALSIFDKAITFLVLLLLSLYGLFKFIKAKDAWSILIIITIVFFAGFLFLLSKIGRNLIKKLLGKYSILFKGFSKTAFFYFKKARLMLFLNTVITFVKWLIVAWMMQIIFLFYGYNLDFLLVLTISAASVIISLLPISLSGLGIKDTFVVFAFSNLGVPASITFAIYLINNIVNYAMASLFIITIRHNLKEETQQ